MDAEPDPEPPVQDVTEALQRLTIQAPVTHDVERDAPVAVRTPVNRAVECDTQAPVTRAEGAAPVIVQAPRVERVYVIWVVPGHPELTGIHVGGRDLWGRIIEQLPGHCYSYRAGMRLRRADSVEEGRRLFSAEAARHRVEHHPQVFWY